MGRAIASAATEYDWKIYCAASNALNNENKYLRSLRNKCIEENSDFTGYEKEIKQIFNKSTFACEILKISKFHIELKIPGTTSIFMMDGGCEKLGAKINSKKVSEKASKMIKNITTKYEDIDLDQYLELIKKYENIDHIDAVEVAELWYKVIKTIKSAMEASKRIENC